MSTFTKLRVSANRSASAGVPLLVAQIAFDPTAASAGTGFVLPKGAVITAMTSLGGSTGGTLPTVDIGVEGATDTIANELASDVAGTAGTVGSAGFAPLAANTEVWAGVGASAATGGTTTVVINYFIVDDREGANG